MTASAWSSSLLALALLGCAAHPVPISGMPASTCPADVEDTAVSQADVEGGSSLIFTTRGSSRVSELRRRVQRMAAVHDDHHRGDGARVVDFRPGPNPGTRLTASTASAEDVEGGARLVLHPRDLAELDALRAEVRAQAAQLAAGSCVPLPVTHVATD
jgi:hypothetical protein